MLVEAHDVAFLKDGGHRTFIDGGDGTGVVEGKTNAFPYTLDQLRAYYGVPSLEG